jgi:prevent-host-death family protein
MVILMEISVTEFKAKCVGIIGRVQRERCRVTIRRHGQPAAELVPVERGAGAAVFGRAAGTVRVTGDLQSTGEAWDAAG